ncbi:MAG: hypothetical protein V8S24_02755 [Gordonibacter pamelaeae]
MPTPAGDMAIAFDAIDEVVPASGVRPFASLLPPEFCGVLHRGAELVPVVDAGGGATGHVVVVKAKGCLLGLKFHGTPSVGQPERGRARVGGPSHGAALRRRGPSGARRGGRHRGPARAGLSLRRPERRVPTSGPAPAVPHWWQVWHW